MAEAMVALEVPVAAETPPAPARACHICPPIRPDQSWQDPCECGDLLFQHKDISHEGIGLGPGITCFGQNHAGPSRNPKRVCTGFRLKTTNGGTRS